MELWSGCRIQFGGMEKRAFQKEAKAALKEALAGLVNRAGVPPFAGYYDSTDPRPADTENSLFTNLLDAMPGGIGHLSFEQGPSDPPAPPRSIDLLCGHLYYYRYEVGGRWTTWAADRTLARWDRVPRRLPGDGSARPAWFALRENNGQVALTGERCDADALFGLRITLHATKTGPHNAITNSESIVDGIIAAFHGDPPSDDLLDALANKLPTVTTDELRCALDALLGRIFDTPAIFTKNGFVQISPADERCRVGELRITYDSASRCPELSGEIFTIRPAGGA